MKVEIWEKIVDRKDFRTHLVYVKRLAKLSSGLSLRCNINPVLVFDRLKDMENKLRLIELTKKSLEDEFNIVKIDKEYSTASVLWLPVKTYYLLYHLLSVIDYILTGKKNSLSISHEKCSGIFSKRLKDREIQFSEGRINSVFSKDIFNFTSKSGEHLRRSVKDDVIYKLVMKKTNALIHPYKPPLHYE